MRENRNHFVRSSECETKEPRKKFFLIYEGTETEPIYFAAFVNCKTYSRIDPMIDLIPIVKGVSKEGWSNPYKLLEGFMADLNASRDKTVTYNTLIDCIVDEACPLNLKRSDFCKAIKAVFTVSLQISDLDKPVPKECLRELCGKIEKELDLTKLVETIPEIVKEYQITYQPNLDKICFIVDRDKHSFVKNEKIDQYGYVLSKCKDNGFGFYLTNPCFEYWLLLHFAEAKGLDETMLLENPKLNDKGEKSRNGKSYTERELSKLLPGFKKEKYDAESLMKRINIAIEQEKNVCEDSEKLEYSVGSRVGLLMQELRQS